jgi:hypothetical protein
VKPSAAWAWIAVLAILGCMTAAVLLSRLAMTGDDRRKAVAEINRAVIIAGGILAVPLASSLAKAAGIGDSHDVGMRVPMVLTGLALVLTGNSAPKTLTPLAAMRCDPARVQAFQRFFGVTCVLTGFAFAVAWLALPVDVANLVGMAVILGGIGIVATQALRLRRPRQA